MFTENTMQQKCTVTLPSYYRDTNQLYIYKEIIKLLTVSLVWHNGILNCMPKTTMTTTSKIYQKR